MLRYRPEISCTYEVALSRMQQKFTSTYDRRKQRGEFFFQFCKIESNEILFYPIYPWGKIP